VNCVKIMTVFGTRPEVIKLAPVIRQLDSNSNFEIVLVTTGQHREMLGQAMEQFDITPAYNLDIMKPGQGVSDVTVESLRGIEELVALERPDLVLVQGDTTTAFASCLAAFYQKTAVGHVEAGLRTYDKYSPFPEEVNRAMITQLADIHFVPTATARESLRREGIPEPSIFITGNTVIDALYHVIRPDYHFVNPVLQQLDGGRRLVVVTAHRRENFGAPLRDICGGIADLVRRFPDIEVVFSVHRNPKVNVPVREMLAQVGRVHLVEPLCYGDMANLISRSYLVLTDSGGLQEEAPALAKPVLVLRNTTERPEAVSAGMAKLIGTSRLNIVTESSRLLEDPDSYRTMSRGICPFGDGSAAARTVGAIEYRYRLREHRPAPFLSLAVAPAAPGGRVATPDARRRPERLGDVIGRARAERQVVSVATLHFDTGVDDRFAVARRTVARCLRDADTAAAIEGKNSKRLVLVLPGAGQQDAAQATARLRERLAAAMSGRRATDPGGAEGGWWMEVGIKTFNGNNKPSGGRRRCPECMARYCQLPESRSAST